MYDVGNSNGASDHLINGPTHTIRGVGNIGFSSTLQITNHGVLEANVGTLNVAPNASGLTNTGILRASFGGTLNVTTAITSNGTIDVGTGSIVKGTSLTNNGLIQGSGLLDLSNTLTNNGLISAGASPMSQLVAREADTNLSPIR